MGGGVHCGAIEEDRAVMGAYPCQCGVGVFDGLAHEGLRIDPGQGIAAGRKRFANNVAAGLFHRAEAPAGEFIQEGGLAARRAAGDDDAPPVSHASPSYMTRSR